MKSIREIPSFGGFSCSEEQCQFLARIRSRVIAIQRTARGALRVRYKCGLSDNLAEFVLNKRGEVTSFAYMGVVMS